SAPRSVWFPGPTPACPQLTPAGRTDRSSVSVEHRVRFDFDENVRFEEVINADHRDRGQWGRQIELTRRTLESLHERGILVDTPVHNEEAQPHDVSKARSRSGESASSVAHCLQHLA